MLCNIEAVAQCVGRPVDYLVTYYGQVGPSSSSSSSSSTTTSTLTDFAQELCVASKIESLKA